MRTLSLVKERQLEVLDVADPPPPQAGEVQIRVRAVALNHLDLWGFRGMAFAKRKFPAGGRRGSLRRDRKRRRRRHALQGRPAGRHVSAH